MRLLGKMHALERERDLAGERFEQMQLLGQQHAARVCGKQRQHAERGRRRGGGRSFGAGFGRRGRSALQRQIDRVAAGQSVRAEARVLSMVEHPLRHAEIGAAQRAGQARPARMRDAVDRVGQQHHDLAVEHLAACGCTAILARLSAPRAPASSRLIA